MLLQQSLLDSSRIKDTDIGRQRIYCNSYTQRVSGNDVVYTVDLGRQYTFQQLQLDQASIENFFSNFYQSNQVDYRDGSFKCVQAGVTTTIPLLMTQFIVDQPTFLAWINDKLSVLGLKMNVIATSAWLHTWAFRLTTTTGANVLWSPVGGMWQKLGFDTSQLPVQSTVYGNNIADLSQPTMILIACDNLAPCISNGNGSALFAIQNTASFGSKIQYTNTQLKTSQTLFLGGKVTISQLQIRILGCDQFPMQCVQENNADVNMTNSEHIFIFSCK